MSLTDDIDNATHSIRAIDRREGALQHLDLLYPIQGEGREVGRTRGDPIDEHGYVSRAGEVGDESSYTDIGEEAGVLDDVDRTLILEQISQILESRRRDSFGANDFDLPWHSLERHCCSRRVDQDFFQLMRGDAICTCDLSYSRRWSYRCKKEQCFLHNCFR